MKWEDDMFKSNRCYNGGNKHKYKAVYEEVFEGEGIHMKNLFPGDLSKVMKALMRKSYIGHVCEWCGAVLKRRT